MRLLFTRRWIVFAVVVVFAAWGAYALGRWQFHRLDERRAENRLLQHNLKADPVPFDEVLRVGKPVPAEDEWRQVTATGTWDDAHTVILKYQTREGGAGVDVVTPLMTSSGAAVLVDRGWMATGNSGAGRPTTPAPTSGKVSVTGWVRVDATGSEAQVSGLATRALSGHEVAKALPYPVYDGFLDIRSQTPKATDKLGATELPDDHSEGPHFFYGLQWWFFGVLAVFGFCYLAWEEVTGRAASRRRQGASHPSRTTTAG